MPDGGFLEQKPRSPLSLGVVIAMHVAAISALALAKMENPPIKIFNPLKIKDVKDPPPPEKPPESKDQKVEKAPTRPIELTYKEPLVKLPTKSDVTAPELPPLTPPKFYELDGPVTPPQPPQPLPAPPKADAPAKPPVRLAARIDSESALQPPYPAVEERNEVEGSVTVRVLIGTDGRVKGVEKVRAANDAFFRATERQALRHWRFKPATVDGKPVESSQVMTVHFQLNG